MNEEDIKNKDIINFFNEKENYIEDIEELNITPQEFVFLSLRYELQRPYRYERYQTNRVVYLYNKLGSWISFKKLYGYYIIVDTNCDNFKDFYIYLLKNYRKDIELKKQLPINKTEKKVKL